MGSLSQRMFKIMKHIIIYVSFRDGIKNKFDPYCTAFNHNFNALSIFCAGFQILSTAFPKHRWKWTWNLVRKLIEHNGT